MILYHTTVLVTKRGANAPYTLSTILPDKGICGICTIRLSPERGRLTARITRSLYGRCWGRT